ncbi:MAG: lysine biosynthesis protein LysX [Halolamina sp.]
MDVGLLYSRIRPDEKLLLTELRDRGHEIHKVDVRKATFDLDAAPEPLDECDVVLDRCMATSRSRYASRFVQHYDLPVVNDPATAKVCSDKVETSLALADAGIPTPETTVAFTKESALEAIERFGYPCVLKPVVGSWGRLMAKLESRSAAEAVLEHKETLGHYEHSVFYVQQFVEKPGRDLRVVTLDGEPVAAMTRSSDHWLTNAATGAETTSLDLDDEVERLAREASAAVGGGLLGVDLMELGNEGADAGYTVHEVNHTVEFKALNAAVEVDVAGEIVDWLEGTFGDDATDDGANEDATATAPEVEP